MSLAVDRLRGYRVAGRREREIRRRVFAPKPRLSLSQWADAYGMLSRSTSAEPGKWRTDRAPYQREIMDTITDPRVQRMCWMAPAQSGKTAIVLKAAGYYIDQDPAPILIVQPSLEFARDFSRDRLKPEIQETPVLAGKVREAAGRRESSDTLLRKEFPGGYLTLVGANSATGLSSRPIRIVLFDEIDKYPASAGDKGDPIALGVNRTRTFWNRKLILISTPGVKGVSRIEREWNESDQRRFFVSCPHCAHEQHLQWKQLDFDEAAYVCEGCGVLIPETEKSRLLAGGRWVATNPKGTFPGFHLNALYSPWVTWKELIVKFLAAKKAPDTLQVFINEDLAELWDPQRGEEFEADSLKSRREAYAAEVPMDVGILTAFVDVQRDWLELKVKGWCAMQRSYLIAHHRLRGDTKMPDVWNRLDPLLTKPYQHESGAILHIALCGIDSGDGENVHAVYSFVAPRQKRAPCPVWATKGSSVRGRPIIAGRPSRPNKYRVRVYSIGTDTAKDIIYARLKLKRSESGEYPPGYMHFPMPFPDGGADDEYLDQFGRERPFIRHHKGVPVREWHTVPNGARNEALDLEVGNLHSLHLLGAGVYDQLGVWAAKVQAEGTKLRATAAPTVVGEAERPEKQHAAPVIPPVIPKPPRRPGGFGSAWRGKW